MFVPPFQGYFLVGGPFTQGSGLRLHPGLISCRASSPVFCHVNRQSSIYNRQSQRPPALYVE